MEGKGFTKCTHGYGAFGKSSFLMSEHLHFYYLELPEQHHKSVPCKLPSPIHQHLQQLSGSPHRSCNLTTALETTYYAKFNYTGPIAQGLTCYAVYKCDGHVETL